jgi:hypothetical protein
MAHFEGKDRRRVERTGLATSCISNFVFNNMRHSAIMVDVSEHGAKFAIEKPSDHVELEKGDPFILKKKNSFLYLSSIGLAYETCAYPGL